MGQRGDFRRLKRMVRNHHFNPAETNEENITLLKEQCYRKHGGVRTEVALEEAYDEINELEAKNVL